MNTQQTIERKERQPGTCCNNTVHDSVFYLKIIKSNMHAMNPATKEKWITVSLLISLQPPLLFTHISTVLTGAYVTLSLFLLQGGQLLFGLRTPHLCFVCIIKETRSKLMKRYSSKLLRRKWGTMSNLRPLLVSAALAVLDVAAAYHGHLHLSIPSFETQSTKKCSKFSKFWKYRCFSFSVLCYVLNTPNTPNPVL